RRHTRWPRDWSSDVCSSDLPQETSEGRREMAFVVPKLGNAMSDQRILRIEADAESAQRDDPRSCSGWQLDDGAAPAPEAGVPARSEERRVGKECRGGRGREY